MKVWVLTRGSYSDYRVVGLFSSMEAAAEYAGRVVGGEANDPFDVELDGLVGLYADGRFPFTVYMHADGSLASAHKCNLGDHDDAADRDKWGNSPPHWRGPHLSSWPVHHTVPGMFSFQVWATDEQHAVKIANEKRVQHIVANPGDTFEAPPPGWEPPAILPSQRLMAKTEAAPIAAADLLNVVQPDAIINPPAS